jgi:integrase
MATINLALRSENNPANIYARFTNTRAVNFNISTGLLVNPKHWDKKQQKVRNLVEIADRDEMNTKLGKLKIHVIEDFNRSFSKGEIINKEWLERSINEFLGRPKFEAKMVNLDHTIYLTDFATWWLKNEAPEAMTNQGALLDYKTIRHYKILNDIIIKFEGKKKIMMRDLSTKKINEFSRYLTKVGYAHITASRMMGRFKFFCSKAEGMNLEINKNYSLQTIVIQDQVKYKHPYLNLEEIDRVYNYDFSDNDELDNARDNFIIGLFTGLRVSDFLTKLAPENILDGFIEIETTKTATFVTLPVHKYIKSILNKRAGFLPLKIRDTDFNEKIKVICRQVGINELMLGGISKSFTDPDNPKKKIRRKIVKEYKKYQLVTSHICRRSFATNLYGKIPNSVLCTLGTWSTEKMMMLYIKSTNRDSANELKDYWDLQDNPPIAPTKKLIKK